MMIQSEPYWKVWSQAEMTWPFQEKVTTAPIVPQGALPVYDLDIDVTATVVSSNGTGAESRVFGERVTVPEVELYSNPTVRIAEAKRRRFNVIDRAVQKARQEIN